MSDAHTNSASPLVALGVTEAEERIYDVLLSANHLTKEELAALSEMAVSSVEVLLARMERIGLVSRISEIPSIYRATSPELAIEALIAQRKIDIEKARLYIPELRKKYESEEKEKRSDAIVEIITDRNMLQRIMKQIYQTTSSELIAFQRAPILFPDVSQRFIAKTVSVRSISDSSCFRLPGMIDIFQEVMKWGEQVKIFPVLPIKMIISDRRMGLMPLAADDPASPILLLRASALLDTLCAFFDIIWARATPFLSSSDIDDILATSKKSISGTNQRLLTLLSAGFNDKNIAHEMGISSATLTRRINDLMDSFDARTRFQLGWITASQMSN